jgi:OmpA-OmpF porin, OOP family
MKAPFRSYLFASLILACSPFTVASLAGCSGAVKLEAKTPEPPPPPPKVMDGDGDGIPDKDDKCPADKEDGLPPDAKDGCPTDDPDKDGIRGDADKCPKEAEVVNGFEDEDGCPDVKPTVEVTGTEIKINDKILFQTGLAKIDTQSDKLIEDIAKVFKDHPELDFVEVAGHADKRGSDVGNKILTQQRSEAVLKRLITLGVAKERLRAAGFGSYCPIDPGDSDTAFEKNRRVEFIILRRDGKELDAKWGGCSAAEA